MFEDISDRGDSNACFLRDFRVGLAVHAMAQDFAVTFGEAFQDVLPVIAKSNDVAGRWFLI
jgi:hypothetical protein